MTEAGTGDVPLSEGSGRRTHASQNHVETAAPGDIAVVKVMALTRMSSEHG